MLFLTQVQVWFVILFDVHIAFMNSIVKQVSWFKSSLLLRINNKHTYKY